MCVHRQERKRKCPILVSLSLSFFLFFISIIIIPSVRHSHSVDEQYYCVLFEQIVRQLFFAFVRMYSKMTIPDFVIVDIEWLLYGLNIFYGILYHSFG